MKFYPFAMAVGTAAVATQFEGELMLALFMLSGVSLLAMVIDAITGHLEVRAEAKSRHEQYEYERRRDHAAFLREHGPDGERGR